MKYAIIILVVLFFLVIITEDIPRFPDDYS